jgi:hypothetical protein
MSATADSGWSLVERFSYENSDSRKGGDVSEELSY